MCFFWRRYDDNDEGLVKKCVVVVLCMVVYSIVMYSIVNTRSYYLVWSDVHVLTIENEPVQSARR